MGKENRMKSAEQDRKLTFREWLEHIWYYYKWQILILGLIAVFVIIATVQLFTKATRTWESWSSARPR